MSVANKMWFLSLPLKQQFVLTSAVDLPCAFAGWLLLDVDHLPLAA
jgi:hypothetical protein